jgi:carbonic anhydrase/acetyltransferase-like protein (isoleucine patch superfamily)
VIKRALAWIATLRYLTDPVAYHRRRGVRIGERVDLIGGGPHTFGSEPYLVTIGDDVTISHGVDFITHDGGLRVVRDRWPDAYVYGPITVGRRAFIGAHSVLMPGVTIGDGAVVGVGSLVTRDVPSGMVVAGVPARPVRRVEEYAAASRERWIDTGGMSGSQKEQLLRERFDLAEGSADGRGRTRSLLGSLRRVGGTRREQPS